MDNIHLARFTPKFTVQTNGCWVWNNITRKDKYVQFRVGKMQYAHIVAYEHWIGPKPNGFDLDHTCKNRSCVNPWHLEPVTHAINCSRGTAGNWLKNRTVCPQRHELKEPNLVSYGLKRGWKKCKTCAIARTLDWRSRRSN